MNSMTEFALLEHCVREDLNKRAERRMAVMNPLRIVIDNYPEDQVDQLDAVNNPEDEEAGSRKVPFSRELYIERDDFMEDPPKKFFRLAPGREVRLRYAYFITCNEVIKDPTTGEIAELRCTYDPETRGGDAPDGRKVKATMHWVSAKHALPAQARLYEHLFQTEDPSDSAAGGDYRKNLNPKSLHTQMVHVEPSLADAKPGEPIQFERIGYFCVDPDSKPGMMVFNRTVTLKDEWARVQQRETAGAT
jgi:glutaminyl-tRNA synthetase